MRRSAVPALLGLAALGLTACGTSSAGEAAGGGPVKVSAGDTACRVSRTELPAGKNVFAISNTGAKTTEVYVYGEGDRIVAEKENIAPGLTYELTAQIAPGTYTVVCKPGMAGDGIRTPVTVAAAAGAPAAGAPAADAASTAAVAGYRAYVQQQVDAVVPLVTGFADAVKAGDVARAKALYAPSRLPWETVEPVAESFSDLDPAIDGREADLDPGATWSGWHRIEKALWVDGSTAGMAPMADRLVADVKALQARVPAAALTTTSIGNGAKSLLDEVATRKITGEEEAWSHTDLVDFAGNVAGAKQAYDVLRPLVQQSQPALLGQLDKAFAGVSSALQPYARGSGYVSYDTVPAAGRQELARVVDALSEPLSQLAAAATR